MRQRFKRTFFRSVPDAPGVYLMFDEEEKCSISESQSGCARDC